MPRLSAVGIFGLQAGEDVKQQEVHQYKRISDAQKRRLEARINDLRLDRDRVKSWIARAWGVEHFSDLCQVVSVGTFFFFPVFSVPR